MFEVISTTIGALGLTGILLAYSQLRLSRRAVLRSVETSKATFVLEIHKWLREEPEEVTFLYRLDYNSKPDGFIFRSEDFPLSEDERHLDSILYKLVFVGGLLRRGTLEEEDVAWMSFIVATVLDNFEVQNYLQWIQQPDQVPGHSEFVDAIFLYEAFFGLDDAHHEVLKTYKNEARDSPLRT